MTNHEASKSQGIAIAWNEGFSDFFSQMVQRAMGASSLDLPDVGGNPPVYIDQVAGGTTSLRLDVPGNTQPTPSLGEDNEVSVARVLWDFYDRPTFSGTAGSVAFVKVLTSSMTSDDDRDLSGAVGALLSELGAKPWGPDVGPSSTDAAVPPPYNDAAATTYGKVLTGQNVAPAITHLVRDDTSVKVEWKPGQPSDAKDKLNLFLVQFWDSSWSRLLTEQVVSDFTRSLGCTRSQTADLLNYCLEIPNSWRPGIVNVVVLGWNTATAPPGLTMPSDVPGGALSSGHNPLTGPYVSAPALVTLEKA
jgi:hypothetical protein